MTQSVMGMLKDLEPSSGNKTVSDKKSTEEVMSEIIDNVTKHNFYSLNGQNLRKIQCELHNLGFKSYIAAKEINVINKHLPERYFSCLEKIEKCILDAASGGKLECEIDLSVYSEEFNESTTLKNIISYSLLIAGFISDGHEKLHVEWHEPYQFYSTLGNHVEAKSMLYEKITADHAIKLYEDSLFN